MEYLNRGLVAVKVSSGVFLSWRLLGNDNTQTTFKIYRGETAIKTVTATEATNFTDKSGEASSIYKIETYSGDKLIDTQDNIAVWANQYKTIKLQRPAGGTTPPTVFHDGKSNNSIVEYLNGWNYTYAPNDCSVGDLDGDGEYEIVVKWDPSNSRDNSETGMTGNVYY
jgi:rhamnogalacturonan endolyase